MSVVSLVGCMYIEDVPLVEFMYHLYVRRVAVGDSSLNCFVRVRASECVN